jgi:hypothetical protein
MEVAIISPAGLLRTYSVRSKWQMALAQHVIADEDYARYFWEQHEAGDYIILDNGTAEDEAVSPSLLLEAASRIAADEVILPDVWQDGRQTAKAVAHYFNSPLWDLSRAPYTYTAVAQGAHLWEWLWCFLKLLTDARVDVIGIPKNLDTLFGKGPVNFADNETGDIWYGRLGVVNWITEVCDVLKLRKPLHLLGIGTDYRELAHYTPLAKTFIRSVDTSSPVHCGLVGVHYPSPYSRRSYVEPQKPMNMHWEIGVGAEVAIHAAIQSNIDLLLELAEAEEVRQDD